MNTDAAQAIIDSRKPELTIPAEPMTPREFTDSLSEYGIVCPEDCIFNEILCTRSDFTGDRYSLGFYKPGISNRPAIELSITMKKDIKDWRLHMIFDSRETENEKKWQSKPMTKQWLRKMDSGDELRVTEILYDTENTTMFGGETVYTTTSNETRELDISPVELINAILRAKSENNYTFLIDRSLLQPN